MKSHSPLLLAVRLALILVVGISLFTGVTIARADSFDGFVPDGRFVVSGKHLCEPVARTNQVLQCSSLTLTQLAKLTLDKPKPEMRSTARYSVTIRGDQLRIEHVPSKNIELSWLVGSPVKRVRAIYLNKPGTTLVAEYETRRGGRMLIAVAGFKITPRSTRPAAATPSSSATIIAKPASDEIQKKLDPTLRRGWKMLARKRYKKAVSAASAALSVWDQSAEALSILAAAKARLKDTDGTLDALDRLALSTDPLAPEYRVEARTATAFESLRVNPRFRMAVGITRHPTRPLTAYERVMGLGGHWEQRLISCQQPGVKLRLRRVRKRFTLAIKSRCGGPADVTELSGRFATSGTNSMSLIFPNHNAGDEDLVCQIEQCTDNSGEDCLHCQLDEDLEFLLRVTRR